MKSRTPIHDSPEARELADHYIALRRRISELNKEARELGLSLPRGRSPGTDQDVMVTLVSSGWRNAARTAERWAVRIVAKLKPPKETS